MENFFSLVEYSRSIHGKYEILAEDVAYDNIHVSYYKYLPNAHVKKLGGCYCLHCYETNQEKFYRSEASAMKDLDNFINKNIEIVSRK